MVDDQGLVIVGRREEVLFSTERPVSRGDQSLLTPAPTILRYALTGAYRAASNSSGSDASDSARDLAPTLSKSRPACTI